MDSVADFLTRVRNAGLARHEKVDIPSSNLRIGIAQVLLDCGYIRSFKVAKDGRQGLMRVYLKYTPKGQHVINKIMRVSRPGKRVYVNSTAIPVVRSGFGQSIVSTNKGIVSGDKAKELKVGGELLAQIW
jgi:small subunit ribosomal protein S8